MTTASTRWPPFRVPPIQREQASNGEPLSEFGAPSTCFGLWKGLGLLLFLPRRWRFSCQCVTCNKAAEAIDEQKFRLKNRRADFQEAAQHT